MSDKATERPWRIDKAYPAWVLNKPEQICSRGSRSTVVADCDNHHMDEETYAANARLILTAVNHHEALVKFARKYLKIGCNQTTCDVCSADGDCLSQDARALLETIKKESAVK